MKTQEQPQKGKPAVVDGSIMVDGVEVGRVIRDSCGLNVDPADGFTYAQVLTWAIEAIGR